MTPDENKILMEIHSGMGGLSSDVKSLRSTLDQQHEALHGKDGITARVDRCEQQLLGFRAAINWVWTGIVSLGGAAASGFAAWWNSRN